MDVSDSSPRQMEPVSEQMIDRAGRGPNQQSEDRQRHDTYGERDSEKQPVFLKDGYRHECDRDGWQHVDERQRPDSQVASNNTRRPTARFVAAGGVCQRDRLTRSTALSMGSARVDHVVKRCVAKERLVSNRGKVGRSRPSIISTAAV